jgi:hypothetical protein
MAGVYTDMQCNTSVTAISNTCIAAPGNTTALYGRLLGTYSAPTCSPQPPATNKTGITYQLPHTYCCP